MIKERLYNLLVKENKNKVSEEDVFYVCFRNSVSFYFCVQDNFISQNRIKHAIFQLSKLPLDNNAFDEVVEILCSIRITKVIVGYTDLSSAIEQITQRCKASLVIEKERENIKRASLALINKTKSVPFLFGLLFIIESFLIFNSYLIFDNWKLVSYSSFVFSFFLVFIIIFVTYFLSIKLLVKMWILMLSYAVDYLIVSFFVWIMFIDRTSDIDPYNQTNFVVSLCFLAIPIIVIICIFLLKIAKNNRIKT